MDDIAFDRLTRLCGSPLSRRGGIRAVLGLILVGAAAAHSPNVLADDAGDEFTEEAFAGGRGALDDLSRRSNGRRGGKRRGRRQNRDRDREDDKNEDKESKSKDKRSCTKAGQKRRRGKPCCNGLYRDSADRCIKAQPSGGSAGGCDPNACPSDPATKKRGFCCPEGFCSCGGTCCPECGIETVVRRGDINAQLVAEREVCCSTCSDSEDTCCAGCGSCAQGTCCIHHTPIAGGSIRRR